MRTGHIPFAVFAALLVALGHTPPPESERKTPRRLTFRPIPTDADRAALEAAQAKRERKAAKRAHG